MTISETNQKESVLCRVFGHRFGEWEYESANTCEQIRICKRDSYKERQQAPHQFKRSRPSYSLEWKYIAHNSCEQVISCQRCEYEQERRTLHAFSEWSYVADNLCEQVGICRCGHTEGRRTLHTFSEWTYVAEDSCNQVRVCKRDSYKDRRQAPHEFGEWEYGTKFVGAFGTKNIRFKTCQRCGYKEEEEIVEVEESPEDDPLDFMPKWGVGDKPITTCKTCGGHGTYGYGNPCPECGAV